MAPAFQPARATCTVCPHRCELRRGQRGVCHARLSDGTRVVSENYGRVTSLALDPVEKKPLSRYHPGASVVSVGSYGCNLACAFCQNHTISQAGARDVLWHETQPAELVDIACTMRERDPSVIGIAYTYNEPLVGWEYVRDCAQLAHEAGLANVLVSNGVAHEDVIRALAPLIDAANIDLKAFDSAPGLHEGSSFYTRLGAGPGAYDTVKRTIEILAACPTCHLEVTTLAVTGKNDTDACIDAAARWLAQLAYREDPGVAGLVPGEANRQVVYHITRFFPRYRTLDLPATPTRRLARLREIAMRYLDHVELGNC